MVYWGRMLMFFTYSQVSSIKIHLRLHKFRDVLQINNDFLSILLTINQLIVVHFIVNGAVTCENPTAFLMSAQSRPGRGL